MRPLEPVAATRFNFDECIKRSEELGEKLAEMSKNRTPFKAREEGLEMYDRLPYINMSRADERRLLASLVTLALPEEERSEAASGLAKADALAAEGHSLESAAQVTEVYNRGMKIYSKLNG